MAEKGDIPAKPARGLYDEDAEKFAKKIGAVAVVIVVLKPAPHQGDVAVNIQGTLLNTPAPDMLKQLARVLRYSAGQMDIESMIARPSTPLIAKA